MQVNVKNLLKLHGGTGGFVKSDSCNRLPIRIRRPINGPIFRKQNKYCYYFNFKAYMFCLGYAIRPQSRNQLFFMLQELVFLGYHWQFALYSYSCKILQPYVAATVRMQSDAVN